MKTPLRVRYMAALIFIVLLGIWSMSRTPPDIPHRLSGEPARDVPAPDSARGGRKPKTSAPLTETGVTAMLEAENVSMVFHGIAVDQDGAGLAEVAVEYEVVKTALVLWSPASPRTVGSCMSAADGTFIIRGHGTYITVKSMNKADFRESARLSRTFCYSPTRSATVRHIVGKSSPAKFVLVRTDLAKPDKVYDERLKFTGLDIFGDGDDGGMNGSITIYINRSGARNIDHD